MASLLKNLYWHCRVNLNNSSAETWDVVVNDYPLEKIQTHIVIPWRSGQIFFLEGRRIHPEQASIQIVHTPNDANYYTTNMVVIRALVDTVRKIDIAKGMTQVTDKRPHLPFMSTHAEDHTNEFLVVERQQMPNNIVRSKMHLRRILSSPKLTDSDIEAICIDIFPAIQVQLSTGMDRQGKLNILLRHGEETAIYDYLELMHPELLNASKPAAHDNHSKSKSLS